MQFGFLSNILNNTRNCLENIASAFLSISHQVSTRTQCYKSTVSLSKMHIKHSVTERMAYGVLIFFFSLLVVLIQLEEILASFSEKKSSFSIFSIFRLVGVKVAHNFCERNEVFKLCRSTCPLTCDNFKSRAPRICPRLCRSGCDCRRGYVLNLYGKCVKSEDCELFGFSLFLIIRTTWCSEIASLTSLQLQLLHASSSVREPISLHQAM